MGRVSTPVLVSSPSKVKLAHMVGSFIPILVAGLLPLAIVCWSIVRYFPPGPEDPSYLFTVGRTIWERGGGRKKIPLLVELEPGSFGWEARVLPTELVPGCNIT